jgi:hypothetical protein
MLEFGIDQDISATLLFGKMIKPTTNFTLIKTSHTLFYVEQVKKKGEIFKM